MEQKWLYGIVGLLIGVLIAVLTTSNAVNNNNSGMMGNIDQHFIEQMIPHHEDAITMANLALEKAAHPEIKKLAQEIIKAQSDEITNMKALYKDWFGTEVPQNVAVMGQHGMMGSGMHMGMMGDATDTDGLKNAANFDKTFIEEMIPHHQMAVMMANMLLSGTNKTEMRQLAENIITSQTKEINDMRSWYKTWGY